MDTPSAQKLARYPLFHRASPSHPANVPMLSQTLLRGSALALVVLSACTRPEANQANASTRTNYVSPDISDAEEGASLPRARAVATELTSDPRIVSLIPSATELLYSLGRGGLLVGRSAHCNYPAQVESVPSIGSGMQPDLERIASLRPDLVLLAPMQEDLPAVEVLRGMGIEIMILPDTRLSDVGAGLRMLGSRVNRFDDAIALNRVFEHRLQAIEMRAQGLERPKALVTVSRTPIYVAGPESRVGRLLRIAGGTNAQRSGSWVGLDAETLASSEASVIIDTSGETSIEWWQQWTTLPAATQNRICIIDTDIVSRPTLRLADAAELFADCLHPGVFGSPSSQEDP